MSPSSALASEADENLAFPEKFGVRLSSYYIDDSDTTIAILSDVGIGTAVDFANDLGGEDSMTVPRIDIFYRINERHRLEFAHFSYERDARKLLQINISWDELKYSIGDTLISEINYELYRVGYAWSFYRSSRVELSLSTGLNFTRYGFKYELAGGGSGDVKKTSAPLPMVGLSMGYAISPNWSIHYLAESFFIEVDDNREGSLLNYELTVQYRFLKHYHLGAGLAGASLDLSSSNDDGIGNIIDRHDGFLLFFGFHL